MVNYDLPNVPEDYVHRIGRTGRAGASGEAISLVCIDEAAFLHAIERLIKREIPVEVIAGFEPDPKAKAEPIQLRSPGHRPQRGAPRGQPKQGKAGGTPGQKPAGGKRPATAQRFGSLPGASRGGAGASAGQGKKPAGRGGSGNSR